MGSILRAPAAPEGGTSRSRISLVTHPQQPSQIQPADLLAVELHSRADRKRIQRATQAATISVVAADLALVRAAGVLRHSRLDPLSQERVAAGIRTALRAHYAALLQIGEIDSIARRMGVA